MSKVIIAGDAAVVKSELTLEQLKTIKRYRPQALVLKGGEDGKEPIFAIDVTAGCGEINAYGTSFGRESHDEAKVAMITLVTAGVTGDVKEYIADKLGGALIKLNQLEETLPAVLAEIEAEKATVLSNISVAE